MTQLTLFEPKIWQYKINSRFLPFERSKNYSPLNLFGKKKHKNSLEAQEIEFSSFPCHKQIQNFGYEFILP